MLIVSGAASASIYKISEASGSFVPVLAQSKRCGRAPDPASFRQRGDADDVLAQFTREGVHEETLAADLQSDGIRFFEKSWKDLLACVASKSVLVKKRSVQASKEIIVT